jgi:hypothetical protein
MANESGYVLNIDTLINQAFTEGMAQAMGRYFFVIQDEEVFINWSWIPWRVIGVP